MVCINYFLNCSEVQSARPSAENQRNLEVAMAYILNKIACKHNWECLVLQLLVLFNGFDM